MKKTYILDTNILLESPNAIFGFADNTVAITTTTLQELDSKKNLHNEIGFNARETCRLLEAIREKGDLTTGVELDNGGKFMVLQSDTSILPASYSKEKPDNQIIGTTLFAKANSPDENVILVTNDISMRINASACGLNQNVQAYKNDRIASDKEIYLGRRIVETNNYAAMEKLAKEKTLELREFDDVKPPFIENEFLTIKCGNQSLLGIYQNGNINLIDSKRTHSFGITPKNAAQHFALHALLAPVDEIPFVILKGGAGCVDCDTEFFNGKQWKKISEWQKDDKVLQFDTNTNQATLVTPTAYIKLPCDEMYHFETKYGINQTLSPEHRVLYYTLDRTKENRNRCDIYSPVVKEITAEELFEKQMNGNGFNGSFKTTFLYSGEGISLSDCEIKLMCAVICDGTFNKNNPKSNRCTINIKKDRKIKALRELLIESGLEFKETKMKNGYTRFMFYAPRREKYFSSYWYNCNSEQLELICENILQWDGCETNNRRCFTQANKESIDFIQFAFATIGQRASVKMTRPSGEKRILNGKTYYRKNDVYGCSITDRNMTSLTTDNRPSHKKTVIEKVQTTDGYKYCFNVPTHALVLRRKGCIFITGNCAKTFLSLVGGLDQVYNSKRERSYDKILISRNNVMADADFGYLPGDLEEKMNPLMAPFYDNLQSIIRSKNKDVDNREIQMQIEDMFETGIIEICPLAYMRGRSITNSYLIVDETQNATRSQIRDIITRAGQGTKVIICGDPNQIDNPVLDKWNNGLVFAAEKMKGSKLCAQITFDNSESVRSPLAKEGINRLV